MLLVIAVGDDISEDAVTNHRVVDVWACVPVYVHFVFIASPLLL